MESKKSNSPTAAITSKLFTTSIIETKDELDDRHERCLQLLLAILADKTPKEANDALLSTVSKDTKTHEDICIGFLVAILSSGPPGTPEGNEMAARYYRDLMFVNRDNLQCVSGHLTHLILEKYPKMSLTAKQQLLWLIREMVHNQVQNTDLICWNIMRQIAGGDTTRGNLWLTDSLLEIFSKYRNWLDKFQFLTASVVYTYLRLIEDHMQPQLDKLREKEVKFVVSLLRERFNDVTIIGRDLVRVLQYVAKVPEIETVWRDILHNPKSLSPTFTGLVQLMQTRTSRRFLQSRITPDMEKKIVFLTSQVRFGAHKRYQEWFQRQYLSVLESQSLRCDLIRFIVGVIHPTNELLGSDIIPRWAVIGWLLTTCTSQVAASNAKLALFYDWLFFEPDKDNIMNIEPAILVMHHSMKPHPAITATLLDFLCRIVVQFLSTEQEKVRAGIYNSLRQILDKRVLPSLEPLFDNPRLDRELRTMLRERFAVFIGKEENSDDVMVVSADDLVTGIEDGGPSFSDDEEDVIKNDSADYDDEDDLVIVENDSAKPKNKKSEKLKVSSPSQNRSLMSPDSKGDEEDDGDILDDDAKELLQNLRDQADGESRCEIMEQLVKHITSEEFSFEQCSIVASHLSEILHEQFQGKIFPRDPTPESVEDSIGKPLFVAFRALVEMADSDPHRGHILQLLAELYALQPRIGYYLLYFMNADRQVRRDPKAKANIYRDLCEKIDLKYSLDICLVNDMRQCQEDDVELFVYLIPEVYTNFPKASIGNVDLLYLLVSCVDSRQICSLAYHIMAKDFTMVKKDCYQDVLSASLNWETFEQIFLWQLLRAHDLPLDCVLPLVPTFSASKDHEALTNIALMFKHEKPTADLLKHLLAREASSHDQFVSSIITHWMHEYDEKLGDLISSHLFKQASGGAYKRKRNQPIQASKSGSVGGSLPRSAEMVLAHLDLLRQTCKKYEFFNQRSIQSALQQVRHACTESQKKKFMDLFALADSDSEDEMPMQQQKSSKGRTSGTSSGGGGGHSKVNTKSPAKSKPSKNSTHTGASSGFQQSGKISESSTESSGDSEEDKPVSRGRGQARGGGSKQPGGKPRKRPANRVSYKEMASSDESSGDQAEDNLSTKKNQKKRKKVSPSDSE